jgi:3-phosphoshikimate 1-carboxyvinyltransferase
VRLPRATRPVRGKISPPPSKSITHRALIAAALCPGQTRIENPLDAEDSRLTAAALGRLGAGIRYEESCWTVDGFPGGRPGELPAAGRAGESAGGSRIPAQAGDDVSPLRLELGNSGTSLRLLLPVAALGSSPAILDGVERLRRRPVGPLVDSLRPLGANVDYLAAEGCPPVRVQGPLNGGETILDASQSSQYLSGLLMAGPRMAAGVRVRVTALSSEPYVELTRAVLARFGVPVERSETDRFRVAPGEPVSPGRFRVEADASGAAFLLAAGVVTGGRVCVRGVGADSLQGDRVFLDYLARMGCRTESGPDWLAAGGLPVRGVEADLNATPDLVPPLAAVALFAPGPSRLTGIGHLRLKESDRIAALAAETAKLGARVEQGADFLALTPSSLTGAEVSAHGDHRIAMALAIVGLVVEGLELDDPDCVAKSYPGFFDDLSRLLSL